MILTFSNRILWAVSLTGENCIPSLAPHLPYLLGTRLDRGQKQNIANGNQELKVGQMLGELELLLKCLLGSFFVVIVLRYTEVYVGV